MASDRRRFLQAVTAASAAMLAASPFLAAQNPAQRAADPDEPPDPGPAAKAAKAALEENQKDIRKNVEHLFQLASDLKKEVEKTDSTVILSVSLLRKTEEIEKLARQIRNRAKG
ncbi:MAG: twin-arginine translocation signal domain-containing protein [Acidobacteriia bacterium]|nr:twin-arginine translocation signal domain-containing protein [Terriglobia bacterium]